MAYGNGQDFMSGSQAESLQKRALGDIGKDSREPAITRQAATLEKRLCALTEMVTNLEQRLCTVTMPEPPSVATPVGSRPIDQHSPVVLAQHLGTMNDQLDQALTRLGSLLQRIEL